MPGSSQASLASLSFCHCTTRIIKCTALLLKALHCTEAFFWCAKVFHWNVLHWNAQNCLKIKHNLAQLNGIQHNATCRATNLVITLVTIEMCFTKKELLWLLRERMPSMRCNWAIRSSDCHASFGKSIQTLVSPLSPSSWSPTKKRNAKHRVCSTVFHPFFQKSTN